MRRMCVVLVSVALLACVIAFPQNVPEAPVPVVPVSQPPQPIQGLITAWNNAANTLGSTVNAVWTNVAGFTQNAVTNTAQGATTLGQNIQNLIPNPFANNQVVATNQKQTVAEKVPVVEKATVVETAPVVEKEKEIA